MAPLAKTTELFACHQVPLELDIYQAADYPEDAPVLLFFHSGGLVGGARSAVPPWLVQACYQRKWPLLSASYRLLPQVQGEGLLDDAKAAFNFARTLDGQHDRGVIVSGASAGFFVATLVATHLEPKPLALLSITGITTFKHPFFNSSYLIPPDPIPEEDVERFLVEPVTIGKTPPPSGVFYLDRLLPSGAKNPAFEAPQQVLGADSSQDPYRGMLYDYYLYLNAFEPMVSGVDPGYDWATDTSNAARLAAWPVTVFIQGDNDDDVKMEVCADAAKALGKEKAKFLVAEGQGHLYEHDKYLEDDSKGMDIVRQAVDELDKAVAAALESRGKK